MEVDDAVGDDVDPDLSRVLVVLNASPEATTQVVPGAGASSWELHPALAASADPVVHEVSVDGDAVTVPARTAAVLVAR